MPCVTITKKAGKPDSHIAVGYWVEGWEAAPPEIGKPYRLVSRIVTSLGEHFNWFYTTELLGIKGNTLKTQNSEWVRKVHIQKRAKHVSAFKSKLTKRQIQKVVAGFAQQAAGSMVPLFVPLYTRYFLAFKSGLKKTEHRTYGPRWNEKTCAIGRRVTLSKGYGKYERLTGVIVGFKHIGLEAHIRVKISSL